MEPLSCRLDPHNINIFCGSCSKCKAVSKLDYPFDIDLESSRPFVSQLKDYIKDRTGLNCIETDKNKNADLLVLDQSNHLLCRVEAKLLKDKPFMIVNRLPAHDLQPKEAMAIDLPKLEHYIAQRQDDGPAVPTFVVWHLLRPCNDIGIITVFQNLDVLKNIYQRVGREGRFYKRALTRSDYNQNKKMGVDSKYHFSIRECRPIEELPDEILACLRPVTAE